MTHLIIHLCLKRDRFLALNVSVMNQLCQQPGYLTMWFWSAAKRHHPDVLAETI
jgi:hypothetical protein